MPLTHPDLIRFRTKVADRQGAVTRALALTIHGKLSAATPVATGQARASWHLTKNEIDLSYSPRPPKGARRLPPARARSVGHVRPGDILWVTNNVPHITALNDGHSHQAPKNFVQLTLAEVETFFGELVDRVVASDGGL